MQSGNNGWGMGNDRRLGDLETGMALLKQRVDDHDEWVEESKAHHTKVNTFITKFDAIEAERDRQQKERHEQNTWKLNFIGVCVAIATAAILLATAFIAWKSSAHQSLNLFPEQHSQNEVLAQTETAHW